MLSTLARRSTRWVRPKTTLPALSILSKTKTLQSYPPFKERSFRFPYLPISREFTNKNVPRTPPSEDFLPVIPFGIQDFELLRNDGFLYIDKTRLIYQLALTQPRVFFARPRRFGKSLVVSTLRALFEGKRHLFGKDVFLGRMDDAFWSRFSNKFAVISLDLSQILSFRSREEFRERFSRMLRREADFQHSIQLAIENPSEMLANLVGALLRNGKAEKVVILIDEYDAPMNLAWREKYFNEIHQELRSFFSMVKSLDRYFGYVFITGIAKYPLGMNNLRDVSHLSEYQTLCGFTEKEVRDHFQVYISELASKKNKTEEEIIAEIVKNFDGYRFIPTIQSSEKVISPQILYSYLDHGHVQNASWFSTGSPTFLLEMLKSSDPRLLQDLAFEETKLSMSEVYNSVDDPGDLFNNIPLLLFQTGYLTFAPTAQPNQEQYRLMFPNLDVKHSLSRLIAQAMFRGKDKKEINSFLDKLKEGDYDGYFQFISTQFNENSFKSFRDYHQCFSAINRSLANCTQDVTVETLGESDTVITFKGKIAFIVEHKLDKNVEVGVDQIKSKSFMKYALDSKIEEIYLVSIDFSSSELVNIKNAVIEKVSKSEDKKETYYAKRIFTWKP